MESREDIEENVEKIGQSNLWKYKYEHEDDEYEIIIEHIGGEPEKVFIKTPEEDIDGEYYEIPYEIFQVIREVKRNVNLRYED